MALYWQSGEPEQLQAVCERRQAEHLLRFDHHRVVVRDRWGILITHHWLTLEDLSGPLTLKIVFHPEPQHQPRPAQVRAVVQRHPLAPAFVQPMLDELDF